MGDRSSPVVAFGFPIGAEEEVEIDGFPALVEASDNLDDHEWPVELVPHGHHEYRYWFLSVRGTSDRGGDWGSVLHPPAMPPDADKVRAAKEWCAAHGIDWQEPRWSALAAYN